MQKKQQEELIRNIKTILFLLLLCSLVISGCGKSKKIDETTEKIEVRYDNGKIKERYYIIGDKNGNPVRHGKYIFRYENGQIFSECTYEYGLKVGRETFWHENGRIKREILYENGEITIDVLF